MRVILVEDDLRQASMLAEGLHEEISQIEIKSIATESEFRRSLEKISLDPPDLIILDVMLKWTELSRNHESAPEDVLRGKFHRAGFRCQKLLEQGENTKHIPVVLYSMVDPEEFVEECANLPLNVHVLNKEEGISSLVALIKACVEPGRQLNEPDAV